MIEKNGSVTTIGTFFLLVSLSVAAIGSLFYDRFPMCSTSFFLALGLLFGLLSH